jgi:ferredoxin
MNTTIYYFSATGNSLHFARELAQELHTENIFSIAEAMDQEFVETDSQRVGLVFPVYAWGPPRIVMDFLEKLIFQGSPYIFSIVTCVGIPAKSFHVNDKCTGCGTCVRVCPRANVLLKNGQPIFKDNCELCHACIQWCPEFAITHPDFNYESPQYRNSKVKVKDLVVNA